MGVVPRCCAAPGSAATRTPQDKEHEEASRTAPPGGYRPSALGRPVHPVNTANHAVHDALLTGQDIPCTPLWVPFSPPGVQRQPNAKSVSERIRQVSHHVRFDTGHISHTMISQAMAFQEIVRPFLQI